MLVVLVIVVVVALVVVGIWYSNELAKKRTEALTEVASRLGFDFRPDKDKAFHSNFGRLKSFSRGHSRSCRNVMTRQSDNRALHYFDYRYTVGHGKNSSTYQQTVLVLQDPSLSLIHI